MSLSRTTAGVAAARAVGLVAAVGFGVYAAQRFGGDRATDLAFNALIIPNALMVVMAVLLPPIFVSVFKSVEAAQGLPAAWAFGRSALFVIGATTLVLSGIGALLAPWVARAVGTGYSDTDLGVMTRYVRWAFLLLFVTGVASVMKGLLNGAGSLILPSLDTMAMNLAALAVLAWGAERWGSFALVAAVVAGGAAKVLLMAPGYRGGPGPLLHPALRDAGRLLVPVLLNSAVFAAGAALLRAYASRIPGEGAASHLGYAEKIFSAPQDLFIVSMGSVILPALAADAVAGRLEDVRRRTATGIRMATFFGIPAAVGLILLAEPVTALLYQRGRFDAADTIDTAAAVKGFALSLVFSGHLILYQAFYALGRTGPILLSGLAHLAGIGIAGWLLGGPWRQGGLGLAWSIGYAAGFVAILAAFCRRLGNPGLGALFSGALRTAVASAMMGMALWGTASWSVIPRVLLGGAVFIAAARFLCPEEWKVTRKLWSRAEAC